MVQPNASCRVASRLFRFARLAAIAAASLLVTAPVARADWVELFDAGLTAPWTFYVFDNEGDEPTSGTPAVTVVPSGGGAYLRMSHSTTANQNGGGGAAAAVGIVDQAFSNGTVRAVLNAAPNDGQRSLLAVYARVSAAQGKGYLLGVDYRSGHLVLQRAESFAGQAITLSSAEIPGFAPSKSYFVELTLSGSSLSGRVNVIGNATTLATVIATDDTIASGRTGIIVRTGYSESGKPLDAIVGTFDNISVTDLQGGGMVPPPTQIAPVIPRTNGVPVSVFKDGVLLTSLDNSAKERLDFIVSGVARGATVRIYADNTIIAEQFSGPGGRILVRTNGVTTLTDGVYDLRASQSVQGVQSALFDAFILQVDTTAPAKPGAPDLITESDTGVSDTDNITRAPELILRGTAEPGAAVALLLKGKPAPRIPTTYADDEGNWTFTYPSGKKGGTFKFSVRAFDAVGNFSQESDSITVQALIKAPKPPKKLQLALEDRDPPPTRVKGYYTNNPMPTITGQGVPGATVRLTVAGTGVEYGSGVVPAGGKWSITMNRALQQGDLLIGATQIDAAGNESAVSKLMKLLYQAPVEGLTLAERPYDPTEQDADQEWEDEADDLGDIARFDVDGDGRVTMDDVRFMMVWIGRDDFPIEADVDEDGDVDADDLASVAAMVGR